MAAGAAKGNRGQPKFPANEAPELGVDEEAVSNYASVVGTRRVGTTAERNALVSPELFTGLLWGDTVLGYDLRYTGSAWKRVGSSNVQFVGSTNVNGIIYVTHNFGSAPTKAQVTLQHGTNEALSLILDPIIWDTTAEWATQVGVRFRRHDTNAWAASQPVQGFLTVSN